MSIGKNIARFRKEMGLTQEELGVKLGVTNQAVSKWESEVSMPDIMLLPEIAAVLGITLEDIYGMEKTPEKVSVSADAFPMFCHKKLTDLFYYNTQMRFTHSGSSDKELLDLQIKKLMENARAGCISNTKGAIIVTEDFSFIDCSYKAEGSEDIIKSQGEAEYILMYLTDKNFRKVFYYQYKTALANSKVHNTEFTFDEIMNGCNLTGQETSAALQLLMQCNLNDVYTDDANTQKYVFLMTNAVYAHAIYKLTDLLSQECPVWAVVRDTSLVNSNPFEK